MTTFNKDSLTRQLDLLPLTALGEPITIIGAGAVGSWVTLALAKMGFGNITIFDDDVINVENLNCQFYRMDQLGMSKVGALQDMVMAFTGVAIQVHRERYTRGIFPGIVISAVDSMSVRRLIWENHKNKSPFTRAVIDPRMGAESALLFTMKPMDDLDHVSYENSLYTDEAAHQERCTSKATIYCALSLSGLVCTQVKALVTGKPYARTAQWNIAGNEFVASNRKAP